MSESEQRERKPEHWGGISSDEMNPMFNTQDGTVILTSEHFSRAMKVGDTLSLHSNEDPNKEAAGEVLEVYPETNQIKVKLKD